MLTSASGIGSLELVSSTFPLTTVLWAMPVKPTKNKVQIDKMNLFILLVKIFMISLLFKTSAKLHYLNEIGIFEVENVKLALNIIYKRI